jgi:hypothetical protein
MDLFVFFYFGTTFDTSVVVVGAKFVAVSGFGSSEIALVNLLMVNGNELCDVTPNRKNVNVDRFAVTLGIADATKSIPIRRKTICVSESTVRSVTESGVDKPIAGVNSILCAFTFLDRVSLIIPTASPSATAPIAYPSLLSAIMYYRTYISYFKLQKKSKKSKIKLLSNQHDIL